LRALALDFLILRYSDLSPEKQEEHRKKTRKIGVVWECPDPGR